MQRSNPSCRQLESAVRIRLSPCLLSLNCRGLSSYKSFVKCQIIVGNVERDVIRKISCMKQPYFDEVVDKIIESIF